MHERALISKTARDLELLAGTHSVFSVTLAHNPETSADVIVDAWRSVTAGTAVGDAELTCVVDEHGLCCLDCGRDYRGAKLSRCPHCGGNGLIVDSAPEVALKDWSI